MQQFLFEKWIFLFEADPKKGLFVQKSIELNILLYYQTVRTYHKFSVSGTMGSI